MPAMENLRERLVSLRALLAPLVQLVEHVPGYHRELADVLDALDNIIADIVDSLEERESETAESDVEIEQW